MKRRSSTASPSKAKRAATAARGGADSVTGKIKTVCKVLECPIESVPADVVKMVTHALPHALGVMKDSRHFTQVEVVRMAKELLKSVEAQRASELESRTAALAEGEGAQEKWDAAVVEAKAVAVAKSEAATTAKFNMQEAAGAEAAAKAALKDLEDGQRSLVDALEEQRKAKAGYDRALHEHFAAIKAGSSDDHESIVKKFLSFGKREGFEGQLLLSADPALRKPAAERGTFDALVLDKLEAELNSRMAPIAEKIASLEAELQQHAPSRERCEAALKAAEEALAARKEEHSEAVKAEKEAKAAIKNAEGKAKDSRPEVKRLTAAHSVAGAAIDECREALHVFEELENLAPEPEEPAAEPAVAERESVAA